MLYKVFSIVLPFIHRSTMHAAFELKHSFCSSTILFQNILLSTAYIPCTFLNLQPNAITVVVNKLFFTLKFLISKTIIIINVTN